MCHFLISNKLNIFLQKLFFIRRNAIGNSSYTYVPKKRFKNRNYKNRIRREGIFFNHSEMKEFRNKKLQLILLSKKKIILHELCVWSFVIKSINKLRSH